MSRSGLPVEHDERLDLELVASYFSERSLSAEPFSREEMRTGKTPDFRIRREGIVEAYCEVKSPNDPWMDTLLKDSGSAPFVICGGSRPDPIFNRLARLLSKAAKQFDAVNPTRSALNILAYVNHDNASRYGDLRETLTGKFLDQRGRENSTVTHIAERIRDETIRIDAFLWFESRTGAVYGPLINDLDEERAHRTCSFFLGFT